MQDKDFIIERQILRIGNKISNGRDKDLTAFNLTANQSETLMYFDLHAGGTIMELKDFLRISHQAARNIVERMKKKDLLYVVISDSDARFKHVYLTEKGIRTCNSLKKLGTSVGQQLLQGLSDEEKNTLLALLAKIDGNI